MHIDQSATAAPRAPVRRGLAAMAQWDWPTLAVFVGCFGVWGIALALPSGWGGVQWVLLVLALTLHSSLSHEILHGAPFNSAQAGTLLGLVQPGLFVPFLRFKTLHLAHHQDADLTDPYDDPESNYLDPAVWSGLARWHKRLLIANNTLLGRMVVGPVIGNIAFYRQDLALMCAGDRRVTREWLAHLPGVMLTLLVVSASDMPLWLYVLACYGALSVLRIRTFLEHRAHEKAQGRSVIIEDRGLLAFLFLNNNLHVVHHAHPQVPWYRLPGVYRARKDRFVRMNGGYVFRSYGAVFARFFWRTKDPVAHPLWQDRRD